MNASILLVEDEADIARPLRENLELEGFRVRVAASGAAARSQVRDGYPDLVILDLMLPDTDGETILRSFRSDGFAGPVLILSARQGEIEKVRGFRLGADDYVTKPFGLLELLARVHALLRRSQRREQLNVVVIGDVSINVAARSVHLRGTEVLLRPKVRELLFALVDRVGETVTRERLFRDVWGYSEDVDSRTLDWHIAELRRKLQDDSSNPQLIRTVRKVGYQLVLQTSQAQPGS